MLCVEVQIFRNTFTIFLHCKLLYMTM